MDISYFIKLESICITRKPLIRMLVILFRSLFHTTHRPLVFLWVREPQKWQMVTELPTTSYKIYYYYYYYISAANKTQNLLLVRFVCSIRNDAIVYRVEQQLGHRLWNEAAAPFKVELPSLLSDGFAFCLSNVFTSVKMTTKRWKGGRGWNKDRLSCTTSSFHVVAWVQTVTAS